MPTSSVSQNKKDIIKRLHYAEGHVRAVCKMVEQDSYCLDIIHQNHGVIEALRKINQLILRGYLGECAWDAVNSKNLSRRRRAVLELVKLYAKK